MELLKVSKTEVEDFYNHDIKKKFCKDLPYLYNKSTKSFLCKAYYDGKHFIAKPIRFQRSSHHNKSKIKDKQFIKLNELYLKALQEDIKGRELPYHLEEEMLKVFPNIVDVEELVKSGIKRIKNNLFKKVKRLKQKAEINVWNYFVTITYNDLLHSEESFRTKLCRCLANLKTKRNWKYMGVFERSPKTNRLHFHAIMYIPDGEMPERNYEVNDYDIEHGRMQTTIENSFFKKAFGKNDFKPMHKIGLNNAVNYVLKYITKTNERVMCSRGIPNEIIINVKKSDFATILTGFVLKFILFDDVIDWERDILKANPKQISIWDWIKKEVS